MKKLTKHLFFSIMTLTMGLMMLSSCSKSNDMVGLIPNDAALVVDMKVDQLWKKGDMKNADKLTIVTLLRSELRSENKKAAEILDAILDDPESTGLDIDKDAICYLDSKMNVVMVAAVQKKGKFANFLENLAKSTGSSLEKESKSGIDYVKLDSESVLAWNKKYAMIVISTKDNLSSDIDKLAARFTLDKKESMLANEQFKEYWSNRGDMSVWYGMANILDLVPDGMSIFDQYPDDYVDLMKKSSGYLNLSFEDGCIRLTTNSLGIEDHPLTKSIIKDFNAELLKYMPKNTYAAMSLAMNWDALLKYMKDSEYGAAFNETISDGVTLSDLFTNFDGSMVASLFDFKSDMTPLFAAAADLKNADLLRSLLDESGMTKNGNMYVESSIPIYIALNNKAVILTNDERTANTFLSGGSSDGLEKIAPYIKKGNYMYANLNINDYPTCITSNIPDQARKLLSQLFDRIEFSTLSNTSGEMVLYLANDSLNSLAALLHFVDDNLMAFANLAGELNSMTNTAYDDYDYVDDEYSF